MSEAREEARGSSARGRNRSLEKVQRPRRAHSHRRRREAFTKKRSPNAQMSPQGHLHNRQRNVRAKIEPRAPSRTMSSSESEEPMHMVAKKGLSKIPLQVPLQANSTSHGQASPSANGERGDRTLIQKGKQKRENLDANTGRASWRGGLTLHIVLCLRKASFPGQQERRGGANFPSSFP